MTVQVTCLQRNQEACGDVDNNIRYSGNQYDEETGLYYLNARMYDHDSYILYDPNVKSGDKKHTFYDEALIT